jgi:Raf kinase inhibitor-like YbhB/YbcL family protein
VTQLAKKEMKSMKKLLATAGVLTGLLTSGLLAAQQQAPPPSKFKMTTSAWADGDWIPVQYTCGVDGGSSPGVRWSDPPDGTASFAVVFHDMDAAPGKGSTDVTHWILWNIPAATAQLPAGIPPDTSPDGMRQGKNIRGANGYQPPCPPVGARPHHYVFELYALDAKLDLQAGASRSDLLKEMEGHVVGKASFVGVFGRGTDSEMKGMGMGNM